MNLCMYVCMHTGFMHAYVFQYVCMCMYKLYVYMHEFISKYRYICMYVCKLEKDLVNGHYLIASFCFDSLCDGHQAKEVHGLHAFGLKHRPKYWLLFIGHTGGIPFILGSHPIIIHTYCTYIYIQVSLLVLDVILKHIHTVYINAYFLNENI